MKASPGDLRVEIFADGADVTGIRALARDPLIRGFTTNPTLMRQAGVDNYEHFARQVLEWVVDKPISFEVFSDDFDQMAEQAHKIVSWGDNVNVKIPITNTRGESSLPLLRALASEGIRVNVTALMTLPQVAGAVDALADGPDAFVSVFAGRIADTGRDPVPLMAAAVALLAHAPNLKLIWASPRELLNVVQADAVGCHVITVTRDVLAKLRLVGHDLDRFSLETVEMFHHDALAAGFTI